jgi:hypothetical protein
MIFMKVYSNPPNFWEGKGIRAQTASDSNRSLTDIGTKTLSAYRSVPRGTVTVIGTVGTTIRGAIKVTLQARLDLSPSILPLEDCARLSARKIDV